MPIDIELMTDELQTDEGWRATAYQCSAGKTTLGYGHNVEDNPLPKHIGKLLLQHDIGEALYDCERLPWFSLLSDVRKRVIINMMFNIGMGSLMNFKRMISAIERNEYDRAAAEMLNSKWASQVGMRAQRLAYMMQHDKVMP